MDAGGGVVAYSEWVVQTEMQLSRPTARQHRNNIMIDAETENQKYTKPCPYNNSVLCVQYPDDNSCGCDPCEECEIKLNSC